MRTSESKTIINQELFDVKLPDYQRIIERLVSKYNVVDGSYYEGLVNFKTNLVVPKHKWYDYKQGYSELLVKHIIDEAKPLKEHYILDPFCGVGTTNLTSVNRGYKTIGFDINPMAILTAKAKTHHYTPKEIALIKKYLESFTLPDSKVEIEGGRVIETSFTEDVLDILLKIRFFVDGINNDAVQDFFRLALISIIDKCSLKIKDGNGLKFKKNYKAVPDLVRLYLDKASEMLSDIRMSNEDKENKIILGSMITEEAFNKVKDMPIGLCVFSPPYANCFDYCEVYKLEFWIGGFVKSYDDFERFRSIALRSHVNSKFSHEFSNSNKDVDTIASLISSFNIWNKNIPDMIRGYFDDMESMIKNLSKILVNKAKCYIVVANSGYKGILVPTDLLLAEIAEKYGYKVCNIYHARKIRSSSQQMHILNTNYNNLMRESCNDSVYFIDRKKSLVDIVQACGRALRTQNGIDKTAYFIIPILIPESSVAEEILNSEEFEIVYNIIQALRSQDNRLEDWINRLNNEYVRTGRIGSDCTDDDVPIIIQIEGIDIKQFSDELYVQIATVNANPDNIRRPTTFGAGERKTGHARIFKTIGDYAAERFFSSLVDPTIKIYKDKNSKCLSIADIKIDNNNISHTYRLGLIEKSEKNYSLTPLGEYYLSGRIKPQDLFRKQMLRYSNSLEDNKIAHTLFPYRACLEVLKNLEVKKLTFNEFAFCIYPMYDSTPDSIKRAVDDINYLRQKYPRLKAINIANRPQILQLLNTYFGTTLTITDIWGTAGTTVKNLYSYFKNHLSLFEDIIEIKNREICIKPGVNANDIDKLLEIDKNIEKVDRKNLFAIYTEVSSCL